MLFKQGEKPIGLASDHAGFPLRKYIIDLFDEQGIWYIDFGTYSTDSVDYPDFGHKLGTAIDNKECDFGIAICGTGNGINMTLNKHRYVRSGVSTRGRAHTRPGTSFRRATVFRGGYLV